MPATSPRNSQRDRARTKSSRRQRFFAEHRWTRLGGEQLEPRLMMAVDTPDIVVGRALSAYSINDVQNNQLKMTYTVYNQEAEDVSGVLLITTLQSGVSFNTASQLPDQNGQELAWSLGTIPAYGRSSVEVTIDLANNSVLTLDDGAEAFSTLNARASSDAAPAAVLKGSPLPAALLASTVDASTTDPFIQEQAARLDYDPQNIIDFLQDDIGYESYTGSLRGARGTLWSSAGNALDEASLGVALFRASGIPAQYAQGTLSDPLAQQLILSMFSESFQTVGYIPTGTVVADPANDPQLLSETRSHYWVQFDTGSGFQNIDTTFAHSSPGQTFTTTTSTFSEVADSLRHKVQVTLTAETYSQAQATVNLNSGLSSATVLYQSFNAVELVGHPLTVGVFVGQSAIAAPMFSSKTNTYTPHLNVGDYAFPDPRQDHAIIGTAFQDVFTNFPLGTQVATGLFLGITLSGPGVAAETLERTLFDRIGYVVRHNGGAADISVNPDDPPPVSPTDVWSIGISAAADIASVAIPVGNRMLGEYTALHDQVSSDDLPAAVVTFSNILIGQTHAYLAALHSNSVVLTERLARVTSIAAYFDRPRITVLSGKVLDQGGGVGALAYEADLLHDQVRVVVGPGQVANEAVLFRAMRGMIESSVEADVFPSTPPPDGVTTVRQVGARAVFDAAAEQGVASIAIAPDQAGLVDTLAISAEAKARIVTTLQAGRGVVVPAQAVMIGGQPAIAWYEVDPLTGETSGVGENGTHQGLAQYSGIIVGSLFLGGGTVFVSYEYARSLGRPFGALVFDFYVADLLSASRVYFSQKDLASAAVAYALAALDNELAVRGIASLLKDAYEQGFIQGVFAAEARFLKGKDPPVPTSLSQSPGPLFPQHRAFGSAIVTSSTSAGAVVGNAATSALDVAGDLQATWNLGGTGSFSVSGLSATGATVRNAAGAIVGTGAVGLSATAGTIQAEVAGGQANVLGAGQLTFYGPPGSVLSVSGEWDSYTATLTASAITVSNTSLTLNGQALPPGSYTITANTATLTGSGATSSPTFSASAAVTVSAGIVHLGPGTGTLTVGGTSHSMAHGATLTGYAGTLNITGGATTNDTVTLAGTAAQVLSVSANPATVSADQNNPATFQVAISSSLAGNYEIIADAPTEWVVSANGQGQVTVTPASGLQSGTYPVRVLVRSSATPDLVAQTTVNVTVTPTAPGQTLTVAPDPTYTVPNAAGAQAPTAFLASVHNRGPSADSYDLTISNLPAEFEILQSGTTITVPPGLSGELGVYLRPTGATLLAPGTPLSFTVTSTSTTNPLLTESRNVTFLMPEAHGLTTTATPVGAGATPGTPLAVSITLTAIGNVPETVNLSTDLPAGLTLTGLPQSVTLLPGRSVSLPAMLTPAVGTPLNTTLGATITAKFSPLGEDFDQPVTIIVRVVAPGADAALDAAGSAKQTGNTNLANRLSDLATGITNLFQTTDSAVFKAQVLAALDAVVGLVAADYFLAPLVPAPTTARAALVAAVTQTEVRDALTLIGDYLEVLEPQLAAVARHGFTFELDRTAAVIQTNVPTRFQVFMQNLGTQTTTYQLTHQGPATSSVVRYVRNGAMITTVTLQPGQVIAGGADGVSLEILSDTSSTLPFAFTATARAAPATQLARTVSGSVTFRPDFLRVASVVADPPFTAAAGPSVSIAARLYNALNTAQDVLASYVVRAPGGAVMFTSPMVAFTLPAQGATLTPLALAPFDTTSVANGEYVVDVTVTDAAGGALPGGTGSGRVRVGLPVSASLVSTVEILSPGNSFTRSSTQSLTITGKVPLVDPFTLIGQVTTSGNSNSLAIIGNIAYVAGSEAVDIVDISNPAAPVLVGSFAQGLIVPDGYTIVRDLPGDRIAIATTIELNAPGFDLLVYDTTNPLGPSLVSNTPISQRFLSDLQAAGNTVLVSTLLESLLTGPQGDLYAIDLAAAGGPTVTDRLFGTLPGAGTTHQYGIELVDADTAYVASFTNFPGLGGRRVGRLLVVNYADPANLVLTRELQLPATFKLYDVAISGNTALVVGTNSDDAGGLLARFNPGHLVLITLDITDRDNPVVVSTQSTTATFPTDQGLRGGLFPTVALVGDGMFAVSNAIVEGVPAILLVDASDPSNIRTAALQNVGSVVYEITVAGGNLYATSADGLLVFDIGEVESIPVTASVQLPAGRARNFNIAPDRVTTAAGVDTLEWDRVLGAGIANQEFTWIQSSPLSSGLFRDITFGGTVAFTSQGMPGTITLPGTGVGALGSFAVDPGLRTVRPGETAEFTVSINDPEDANAWYGLRVTGVPAAWADFPASVQANAQGVATFTLRLTPELNANLADYEFVVEGGNGFAAFGVAGGTLRVAGVPVNAPDPDSHGVVAQFITPAAAAGQGTSARYTFRVTNTGSVTDTFSLAVSGLPAGVTAELERTTIDVPPGASNFREISLVVTTAPGTAPAEVAFALTATSLTTVDLSAQTQATLSILEQGVDVALDRELGLPGETFQMTVTNTGKVRETFDLSVLGPAGIVATLQFSELTLAPAESRVVNVSTSAVDFAVPGLLNLVVAARSRTSTAVVDSDFANLLIQPSTGLTTSFDPDLKIIPVPGTADFILLVNNTGNVEDAFTAVISGTNGPITGSLVDLNGQSTQTIPIFRLPGLSTGAILLRTQLTGNGLGQIQVQVRSLNNDTIVSQATASLETEIVDSFDFGDAPNSYGTLLANNGARHIAVGPQLGAARDPETDGQPTSTALGDDNTSLPDDEDGVVLPGLLVAGTCDCSGAGLGNRIIVNASAAGHLDAWIDFNRNGRFDADEQIATSQRVSAGANTISVSVPATASAGSTYARFRISSAGGLTPAGEAADGEVEDYAVQIFNPTLGSSGVIIDPTNAGGHVLYVKGTLFSDAIVVRQTSASTVTVYVAPFGTTRSFPLNSFDRIVICALAGSDSIAVEAPITKPTVIYGDEDNDAISGGLGPDTIFGGSGDDSIAGWAGDDTISSGPGNDKLSGGDGIDRLVETGSGTMTLSNTQFKVGSELNLFGYFEAATLTGGNAADSFNMTGWSWPVTINGGGGTNTLIDGGNANFTLTETSLVRAGSTSRTIALSGIQDAVLTGGAGNNTFNLSAWPHAATLRGGTGTDSFTATGDGDFILSDEMLLRPNQGMLRLSGFENATLAGSASANNFNVSGWTKAATLIAGAGNDKLIVAGNVNFTLSNTQLTRSSGGAFTLSGFESAELTGGIGNNTLSAATFSGQVKLDGGAGNDTLTSGSGIALLLGGVGNDTLRAGSGRALMIGGLGLDRLTGGSNDDLLIDGQTAHDASAAALDALLAEWASNNSYLDRVAHLTGTSGGANGSTHLGGSNVIHDTAIDILLGGDGADLFFAKLDGSALDVLNDKQPNEGTSSRTGGIPKLRTLEGGLGRRE